MLERERSLDEIQRSSQETKRLFLGIPIPIECAEKILAQLSPFKGRMIPIKNWHITLHFLGNVDIEKLSQVFQALQEFTWPPSFSLTLDHLSAFPTPFRAHLLWIGAKRGTRRLQKLVKMLGISLQNIGFSIDSKPYIPHLTVQRFPQPRNIEQKISYHPLQKTSLFIDRVILYESVLSNDTPLYNELYSFKLL